MWAAISDAISNEAQQQFIIEDKKPINGGDINLAFVISGSLTEFGDLDTSNYDIPNNKQEHQYFVKLNNKDKLPLFTCELENLTRLNSLSSIYVPEVVTLGTTLDKSFLVLSYEDIHQGSDTQWFDLGIALANQHLDATHGQFGWFEDNYIGTTLQPNQWQSNWRTFFVEQRIGWQLQLLAEQSLILGDNQYICDICRDLLAHHNVTPSLVHGDLWQGNVGFVNNKPMVYDPACYFGDREVDIAMTELFGHFPPAFYRGYQQTYPLSSSYENRKVVYNFYHILNHLNMFKGAYIDQAQSTLHRIIALHNSL